MAAECRSPGRRVWLFVDVAYQGAEAVGAGVGVNGWEDTRTIWEGVVRVPCRAPYEPGRFYRRELDPALALICRCRPMPSVVVVDAHVWLDSLGTPGLGACLYRALAGRVAVIGVAKSPFGRGGPAIPVWRGRSTRPLWVSTAGIDPAEAVAMVSRMHGPYRIPTLIARAHRLAVEAARALPQTGTIPLGPEKARDYVENQREQETEGKARRNREEKGPVLTSQMDVAGKVSWPAPAAGQKACEAGKNEQSSRR